MKKFLSFLLTFVMLFSLTMPAVAAEDTRTIYFENTGNWSAVYAYAWGDSGTEYLGGWPGTAMTKVEGETNIYSIEVSTAAINVIFNNNSGTQTADLTIPTDGNDLYSYGTGTWSTYGSAGDTSDQTKGDVTASYTPSSTGDTTATITGVSLSGTGVTYDEATRTYTVAHNATDITLTVTGTNLRKATDDNVVWFASNVNTRLALYATVASADGTEISFPAMLSYFENMTAAHEIKYSNDGQQSWTSAGVYVTYDAGSTEPEPAAVSLKAKLKAVDSAGAEITDAMIASLDGNTVVNTEIKEYTVIFTGNQTMTWDMIPSGYKTPADVSVTVTDTDGDGVGELSSNSSHAAVELVDGVYVITVTLEKDESTGDTPTLPEIIYLKAEGATVASIASFFDSNGGQIVDENGAPMAAVMTAVEGEEDVFSVATGSFPEGAAAIVFYTDNGGSEQLNLSEVTGDIDMFTFGTEVNANGQTLGTWGTYTPSSTGDATATIAGVSITVDGKEYTGGSVTVYSDSTVALTVTGANLQNGTGDNWVDFSQATWVSVTSDYFGFSDDGTTATKTIPASHFVGCSNFEIKYTNDNKATWTSAGIYVTYDAGTPDTYDVNIAVVENGTVSADKQTAAAGETVTLTWTTEGTYELDNIVVRDAAGNEVTIADKGLTAWTFTMPTSAVTVTAAFKEIATTSADIAWGSLAYTYTDEAGTWSAGTAEGAGTVTVTNTGTTAITATPSYAATTDEYGTFTGSFDKDSIGIDAGANWTFKLTLDGTPTKAIPAGTKIGTVTITITEAVEVPDESENAAQEGYTPTDPEEPTEGEETTPEQRT